MKKFRLFLFAIALMAGCRPSEKQKINAVHIPVLDSLITHEINKHNISGAVIRVQQGNSILHRKAYGYARKYNMRLKVINRPKKMTPKTMFDLASLTKVCATTFGIMMLVDQGKMHLDDPISKWLPEFGNGEKKKITIRNLLTHSAGLYQWKPTYYFASNRREQYHYIAALPLKWKVGAGRHYSDLGFILLGDIIERITDQTLDEYLQKKLYQPLGLRRTIFNPRQKGFHNIAATSHGNPFEHRMVYHDSFGYHVDVNPKSWNGWRDYTLRGEVSDGNAWYATHGISGHAGLFSTVDDLQKLMHLLLNRGKFDGKEVISPAVIDTFLSKDKYGNGLGWAMDPKLIHAEGAPEGTFGHTGFTGTSIVVSPKFNLSIILLTNRENTGLGSNGHYADIDKLRQDIWRVVWKKVKK